MNVHLVSSRLARRVLEAIRMVEVLKQQQKLYWVDGHVLKALDVF